MLRLDSSEMGEIQVTPQGGLKIPATFAQPGVYAYRQPDGTIRREYRSPAAVADPRFLASIAGAPVTMSHPRERLVSADNWRQLAVGHASESTSVLADGRASGSVYVMDTAAIKAIANDASPIRQISPGLHVTTYDPTPGMTPDGQPFDGTQCAMVCNHIALVAKGRQGDGVGLRLDSAGDEIYEEPEAMSKITIAGKEYEVGSAECNAELARLDAADKAVKTAGERLARLAAEKLARMKADLRRVKVAFRADADEASLMAEAITKMVPGFSVDGQSPDYIMGAFAAALAMLLQDEGDEGENGKPAAPGAAPEAKPVAGAPPAPAASGAEGVRNDAVDASRAAGSHSLLPEIELGESDLKRAEMVRAGRNMKIRPE